MSDFPEGWEEIQLQEATEFVRDGTHGTHKNVPNGIPLLSAKDIIDGSVTIKEDSRTISETDFDKIHKKYSIKEGDLLLTIVGTIGRAALVPSMNRFTVQRSVAIIRPTEKLNQSYLYNYVQGRFFQRKLEVSTNAGAQGGVYLGTLSKMPILLPPLPEQKKIAAILSSVDNTIAKTKAVIAQTKKLKQGLMQELLTRGIGHTKFKKTEIGEIPESWEVKSLEEFAIVERGKFSARPRNDPKYYNGQYPFVQTGDITKSNKYLESYSQSLNDLGLTVSKVFPKGTILITIAANIGDIAILNEEVACPDSLVGISFCEGIDVDWAFYMLKMQKNYLESKATQNAQKNINLQVLKPMKVAVPPFDVQGKIGKTISSLDSKISSNSEAVEKLESLKASLMNNLLTGRVRTA